jgi:hypothetical protein
VAGNAWQMCGEGKADPDQFGILDMHGVWFIWGNVVRDFLLLNKIEILPWDGGWGYLTKDLDDPLPEEQDKAFHDGIAALTLADNKSFPELRNTFAGDERWRPPEEILRGGIIELS